MQSFSLFLSQAVISGPSSTLQNKHIKVAMSKLETSNVIDQSLSPSKHFDERLSSRISSQPQSPTKLRQDISINHGLQSDIESVTSKSSLQPAYSLSTLQWLKLTKITEQIYSSTSKSDNGDPQLLAISDEYIAVATSKCHVLLFSYEQVYLLKVKWEHVLPTTRVTSLALSIDSTYLAVGTSDGSINLWDLKKPDPIISIKPVTPHELQFDGTHHHIAHLEGSAVRHISFIGSRHTGFVSSDDTGMMILHNGGRSLIGYSCRSKIIFGQYNLANIVAGNKDYSNTILDFHLLPVGSKQLITDQMNLISIITPHSMVVFSLKPEIKFHFKMTKPKISDQSLGMSGCVAWFPATIDEDEQRENLPMLAYSWSNLLTVVDVNPAYSLNELGERVPIPNMGNKKQTKYSESIISLRWLNSRILIALTRSQKLLFYDSHSLAILKEADLMSKQMKYIPIYQYNNIGLIERSFANSIFTLKSSIFIFQHKEIVVANLSNWADVLLSLLERGKYVEALKESKRQYEGGEDSPLLNLPDDNEARHAMMKDYLIQIFKSSLKYIFTENLTPRKDLEDYRKTTHLLIQTCLTISAPTDMYDLIYEKLLEYNMEKVFFEVLENFIFTSEIVTLSPSVLRAMVVYYIGEKDTNTLERLICLLDIEQLDIDLTVTLCKEYHLNETLSYIWTTLLHDVFTPLIEAVLRIKKFDEESGDLSTSEKQVLVNDIGYVYPYISYTLTGRQYPTDKLLPYDYCISAKLNIYYFLFNGSAISWPVGSPKIHVVNDYKLEPAFPYLCLLLKYDSESMLSCLNEAFEDNLLNDNEMVVSGSVIDDKYQLRVSRQYIIDVLLGIFHDDNLDFTLTDNIRLAIFITRNYPKFLQFIRIADSISDEMISLLCKAGSIPGVTPEFIQDCEMGLQSLLSAYKPLDISSVILQVKKAKYYQVLLYLYQSEERYIDVLKLWVQIQNFKNKEPNKGPSEVGAIELFKPMPEILSDALKSSKSSDREEIIQILNSNFELFVTADPKNIAAIVCTFCPELNSEVVKIRDNRMKFEYLREIFNLRDQGKNANRKILGSGLKLEYLKSLIGQKKLVESKSNQAIESPVDNSDTIPINQKSLMDVKIESFVMSLDSLNTEIISLLKSPESKEFEILIKWYIVKYQYSNAIDTICEILKRISDEMEERGYSEEREADIWRCINKAFSVLSINDTILAKKMDRGLVLREVLLLQVIEASVNILNNLSKTSSKASKSGDDVLNVFKKVVQSIFTYVINFSSEDTGSFNNIFKRFLDDSSIHQTKLGDVQVVLKEIFLSYCNDQQILTLVQTLVDADIFENLAILESLKVKGWSPKNIECEACGRKIWGGRIGNSVYESWRDHKLRDIQIDNDKANQQKLDRMDRLNELYVFQCRHTYHRKCLESMGMVNDEDKECILCRQN